MDAAREPTAGLSGRQAARQPIATGRRQVFFAAFSPARKIAALDLGHPLPDGSTSSPAWRASRQETITVKTNDPAAVMLKMKIVASTANAIQ